MIFRWELIRGGDIFGDGGLLEDLISVSNLLVLYVKHSVLRMTEELK